MNIYKNLLAAAVELDIDYELMSSELLSVMSCEQSVPLVIRQREIVTTK